MVRKTYGLVTTFLKNFNFACDLQALSININCLPGKRFLWLACRHHIMELVVAIAFKTAFKEKSVNADIQLFVKFRKVWHDIDKTKYESCLNDDKVLNYILSIKDELTTYVKDQLTNFPQIRDDYKELLVTLLVLGEKAPDYKIGAVKTYFIHTCGALHRARWMARIIYSHKICLYRSQFALTAEELTGLQNFIVFVFVVYIKNWYEAPCALKAAKNDLQLLKDIGRFKKINISISGSVMSTFSRHLWHLSEMTSKRPERCFNT